eukprot:scaffold2353_cov167-Amphora_coffeaeformis.AAC.23
MQGQTLYYGTSQTEKEHSVMASKEKPRKEEGRQLVFVSSCYVESRHGSMCSPAHRKHLTTTTPYRFSSSSISPTTTHS